MSYIWRSPDRAAKCTEHRRAIVKSYKLWGRHSDTEQCLIISHLHLYTSLPRSPSKGHIPPHFYSGKIKLKYLHVRYLVLLLRTDHQPFEARCGWCCPLSPVEKIKIWNVNLSDISALSQHPNQYHFLSFLGAGGEIILVLCNNLSLSATNGNVL